MKIRVRVTVMDFRNLAAMALGLLLLGACATATPYQAATGNAYGFFDQRVETDRWQVGFSGNSLTDRRTVETYLLYRAAEVTASAGFDHFRVVQRDTESESTFIPSGFSQSPFYSGFRCNYAFFGPRGRVGYSPFYPVGFRDSFGYGFGASDFREIVRYEASAEIIMGVGEKPDDDPAYFTADDVLANLGASIQRPEA